MVLPARSKQTHFWRYDYSGPGSVPGYYGNFPNATQLGSGGRVTGEASPGYLPSSESASRTGEHLKGVRIIVLVRDPVERAYSSYKYNYVNAILGDVRARGVRSRRRRREREAKVGIDGHMEAINAELEEVDKRRLVTFEEFVDAEMDYIRKCMQGRGGEREGVMERCFEGRDGEDPSEQWKSIPKTLVDERGVRIDRIFDTNGNHLVRSMLARGMYSSQVDVWRRHHREENVHVMCTSDLDVREMGADIVGEKIDEVAAFIGLEKFDFEPAVGAIGVLNHGSKPGYERATAWDEYWKDDVDPNLRAKIVSFFKELEVWTGWNEYSALCGWSAA